jgi:hypothetical protein
MQKATCTLLGALTSFAALYTRRSKDRSKCKDFALRSEKQKKKKILIDKKKKRL